MSLGRLVVQLLLDYQEFTGGLDKSSYAAKKAADKMQRDIDAAVNNIEERIKGIGGAFVAAFGAAKIVELGKEAVETAGHIKDIADSLGLSASALSNWEAPAKRAGVSVDDLGNASIKFAKAIGEAQDPSTKAARALDAIGLSAEALSKDPQEAMQQVIEALDGFAEGSEKTQIMAELLGKQGPKLAAAFREINKAQDEGLGLSEEQISRLDEIGDAFTTAGVAGQRFIQDVIVAMAEPLTALAEAFTALKVEQRGAFEEGSDSAASWGERIGTTVAFVVDMFDGVVRVFKLIGKAIAASIADVTIIAGAYAKWKAGAIGLSDAMGEIGRGLASNSDAFDRDADAILNAATFSQKYEAALKRIKDEHAKVGGDEGLGQIQTGWDKIGKASDAFYDKLTQIVAALASEAAGTQELATTREAYATWLKIAAATTDAIAKGIIKEGDAWKAAGQAYQTAFGYILEKHAKQVDEIQKKFDELVQKEANEAAAVGQTVKEREAYALWMNIIKVAQDAITKGVLKEEEAWKRAGEAYQKGFGFIIEKHAQEITEFQNKLDEIVRAEQSEAEAVGKSVEEREAYALWLKISKETIDAITKGTLDAEEAWKRAGKAYQDAFDAAALKRFRQEQEKAARDSIKDWQDFQSAGTDALSNLLQAGKSFAQRFHDMMKQMAYKVAELLVFKPVIGAIGGALGIPGAVASNAAATGASGAVTQGLGLALSGAGAFSWAGVSQGLSLALENFSVGIVEGFSSTLSLVSSSFASGSFGAALGAALPILAPLAIVGIIAANWDNWFGEGDAMRSGSFGNNPEGTAQDNFGRGQSPFGTFGFSKGDWFGEDMRKQVGDFLTSLSQIETAIASKLSPDQIGRISTALDAYQPRYDLGMEHGEIPGETLARITRDRLTIITKEINEPLSKFVDSFGGTMDELLGIIGSFIDLQGLMKFDAAEAAIEAQKKASQSIIETYNQQGAALLELANSATPTSASLGQLVSSMQQWQVSTVQLIVTIDALSSKLSEMFHNTAESIQLAILDNEGKYKFYQQQADDLFAQLQASTDPAEIQRLAEKINEDINKAFSLLDPTAQKELAQEFLDRLANVDETTRKKLQDIKGDVIESSESIMETVATKLDGIFTRAESTSQSQQSSADRFSSAVDRFGSNVDKGIQVSVIVDQYGNAIVTDSGG